MELEGTVCDLEHGRARHLVHGDDDRVAVLDVHGVDHDLPNGLVLELLDDVHRPDLTAGVADCGGDASELAEDAVDLDPEGQRELCAGRGHGEEWRARSRAGEAIIEYPHGPRKCPLPTANCQLVPKIGPCHQKRPANCS